MNLWDHHLDQPAKTRPKYLALVLGAGLIGLAWFLWPTNIEPVVALFDEDRASREPSIWDHLRASAVSSFFGWLGWWAVVEGLRGKSTRIGTLPAKSDATGIGHMSWSRMVQVAPQAVLDLRAARPEELEVRWRWPYFSDAQHDHLLRFLMPFLAGRAGMTTDGFSTETGRVDLPRSLGRTLLQQPVRMGLVGLISVAALVRLAAMGGMGDWLTVGIFGGVYWFLWTYEWTRGSATVVLPGIVYSAKQKAIAYPLGESLTEGEGGEQSWSVEYEGECHWSKGPKLADNDRVVLVCSIDGDGHPEDVCPAAELSAYPWIPDLLERRIPEARWQALANHLDSKG